SIRGIASPYECHPGPTVSLTIQGLSKHSLSYPAAGGHLMEAQGIIVWLIIGALAGWIAGKVVRGGGFGLIGNIIVGIIGAFVGGWLSGVLGISIGGGFVASVITAAVGAIILLAIVSVIKRA